MESSNLVSGGENQRKLRRLNGRLQACDPCRSQKVACDHGQPVCQRCTRKKREALCTYTISAHSVAPFQSPQPQRSPSPRRYASPVSYTALGEISRSRDTAASEFHAPGNTPGSASGLSSRASGYIGSASSTTVIDEARESLPNGGLDSPGQARNNPPAVALKVSRDALERGVSILRHLSKVEKLATLSDHHTLTHDWICRIVLSIHQSLYEPDALGTSLVKGKDDNNLIQIAHTLCVNTTQPVDDALEGAEWVAQFTGRNTRWESIGLLLVFWELSRRARPSQCNSGVENEDWREPTNNCIELCDTFAKANLIIINLYNRRAALESMTSGDASLRTANAHAETVACLTFLGYHVEPTTQPYVPTLASELKRVICATVYSSDKSFSTFTGRPPLISGANLTTRLPLDIETDHLFGPQKKLEFIAATSLDERGWSTSGTLSAATCLRARGMLKRIRDEILDLALGSISSSSSSGGDDISMDALLQISQRQAATMAEFPASVMYRVEDIANPEIPSVRIYTQLIVSLEALQNSFFLDRMLLKRGHDVHRHLLSVSYRMVSNTLALWTHFERFASLKRCFQWMVMAFGAPAGGILCKELQKPTLPGNRLPDDPEITRSSIIQRLSLLVGFLDWVDPSAPNAELCSECKIVIQLVLDQTLNGGSGGGNLESAPLLADQFEFEFPSGLEFNLDLLDSFEWLGSGA